MILDNLVHFLDDFLGTIKVWVVDLLRLSIVVLLAFANFREFVAHFHRCVSVSQVRVELNHSLEVGRSSRIIHYTSMALMDPG